MQKYLHYIAFVLYCLLPILSMLLIWVMVAQNNYYLNRVAGADPEVEEGGGGHT